MFEFRESGVTHDTGGHTAWVCSADKRNHLYVSAHRYKLMPGPLDLINKYTNTWHCIHTMDTWY